MFRFSDHEWPLVTMASEGETTLTDMQNYMTTWEGWLARKEPFVVLSSHSGELKQSAKEIRAMNNQWLLKNKPHIAQYCQGVAVLTNSSKLFVFYKPIAAKIAQKTMGCPGQLFTNEAEARSWLAVKLAQNKVV